MSSLGLLSDSEAERDLLDFAPYIETLLDIICDPMTEGPLVIGLFGTWGSGKTSLMRFVERALRNSVQGDGRSFRLVWFDAWKYEKEETLWRSLLLRVIDSLRDYKDGKDLTPDDRKSDIERLEKRLYRNVEWEEKGKLIIDLPKIAQGAAGSAIQLAFAMLPGFASDAVKAAQEALGKGEGVATLFDALQRDVIKYHQEQLRSIEQFQSEFGRLVRKYVIERGQRLVVFVDDLDRCLPEKAIEVLETIKLFLDVKGCIFLLGLDQEVVTRGIKVKYRQFAVDESDIRRGIPIDGVQYLEKIIQLPFRLPKIEPRRMAPFIRALSNFPDPRCGEVFAVGLETNPRKVKRAINVFLFLSKLASRRQISIQPVRLAKVVVIYHSHPALYERLCQKPTLLRDLEEFFRKQAAQPSSDRQGIQGYDVVSASRVTSETVDPPLERSLITDSLKQVLTLYLDDPDASFQSAEYTELESYFTLTRGTIVPSFASGVFETATGIPFLVPTFVPVPAGAFRMGTSKEDIEQFMRMRDTKEWATQYKEQGYFDDEQPDHLVTLSAFEITRYPVTNQEYQCFVKDTNYPPPSHWSGENFPEEQSAHPVVNVNWNDALAYCQWLTQQLRRIHQLREDEIIRLPTEAEWEKAASWDEEQKAKRIWPWGNQWEQQRCNTRETDILTTTPVGKYSPQGDSFYGVADMAGNIFEWCMDWFDPKYYERSPNQNPCCTTGGQHRVARGGSWDTGKYSARCASRCSFSPDVTGFDLGFRCVKGLAIGVTERD